MYKRQPLVRIIPVTVPGTSIMWHRSRRVPRESRIFAPITEKKFALIRLKRRLKSLTKKKSYGLPPFFSNAFPIFSFVRPRSTPQSISRDRFKGGRATQNVHQKNVFHLYCIAHKKNNPILPTINDWKHLYLHIFTYDVS